MKLAIVQYDDRDAAHLGPYAEIMKRNHAYAQKHGYEYVRLHQFNKECPSYWLKPFIVNEYLAKGFDIVAWFDSDATVHDFNRRIEDFFDDKSVLVYSTDNPVWSVQSRFNAGVFFCRGDGGKQLMAEWAGLYPAHLWRKVNGQWNCADPQWAGPAYEQGAFAQTLLPKYESTGLLQKLPWQVLQSPYPLPVSFSVHFAQQFRFNTMIYLATQATG